MCNGNWTCVSWNLRYHVQVRFMFTETEYAYHGSKSSVSDGPHSGPPNLAEPLLLLGKTTPNHSASCSNAFTIYMLWGFLRRILEDFGIHQRPFKETSLTASIFPRRSGRSPPTKYASMSAYTQIYIYIYTYICICVCVCIWRCICMCMCMCMCTTTTVCFLFLFCC